MIRVTFADEQSRDKFATRFNLTSKVDTTQLDMPWHLLQFAKLDNTALDYDELAVLTASPDANAEREFIVKGDPAVFAPYATIVQDLGKGFWLVKSTDGTLLGDYVESIEQNAPTMNLMAEVSNITKVYGTPSDIDPTSAEAQWHRIRAVSRYRPLASSFNTHDLVFQSKPELIIMDSGINFDHPEFDYPELEKEDFYSLPVFNGNYRDDVGHGTTVASIAVGKNLGIASNVKLLNCKIGGAGHNASVLEVGYAIDAIIARASADPLTTRIVNMSWGVPRSAWLDEKVQSLLSIGITVICAAGNQGISVEDISPAGIDQVITVGSIDKFDIPSGFNDISPSDAGVTTGTGLSLDIFAPGEGVVGAYHTGGYYITNGTSISSPLVAGVAATIASLRESFTPYSDMKNLVLMTATKDALLFEDDRFSDNQNNLIYLFTSDTNSTYKTQNLSLYLGVHNDNGEPIVASVRSAIDTSSWPLVHPDNPIVWSIKFSDPEIENTYKQYFELNTVTGVLNIAKPNTVLPESVKLQIVEFTICATNGIISAESTNCFFFDANSMYKDTKDTDITLALTDTNSISFYQSWGLFIK